MNNVSWFEREEDWTLKRAIIFNKDLVRLTFLEVGRLVKLIGDLKGNCRVLDLCCGIGRHSIQFAKHGFSVTAVDITKLYLDIASKNAQKERLGIRFIHSDMRTFCEPGSFDLVVNLCTSFGYFDDINDDIAVIKNIYKSLVPGGRFVIEILGKEVIASTLKVTEELEFEGYKVLATTRILENWNRLECTRLITKDGKQEKIIAYHRLYSATELKTHIESVGFKNQRIYGDFSGRPYDNNAQTLIIIAEK